jgi:hypothetical protein
VAHGDVEFELEADPSSMQVEKRNFIKLAGEVARDYFGKRHEAGLRVGWLVRRRWKDPAPSAV